MFLQHLSNCSTSTPAQNAGITVPISFHVGIILDLETWNGKMSYTCISTAIEDFYALNYLYRSRMVLHPKDSKGVASAVVAAMDLLKDGVQAIVGPQMSAQAEVVAELGNKSHVPVVSFSATSPSLSRTHLPYFIRMTQDDSYQLDAIVSLIHAFKWKNVILVYEETDYGKAIIPFLVDKFQIINVHVSYRCAIHPSASEDHILKEVHKLSEMTVRVFIVHMSSPLGPRFFLKVKQMGLMSEGLKTYIPKSKELDKFWVRIIQKTDLESATFNNLNIYCLHAYDTITALATAAERVSANSNFQEPRKCENLTDSSDLGVSEIGPDLLKEILNSKFKGFIGNIHLVDGQLQPLIFQIVNVERVEREIGFWVPMIGISQKPYVRTTKKLGTIIWPGDSTVVPKGWVIPPGGKKLKIGYPVKQTFTEFVKVEFNHTSNEISVTGYCIDIFKAVIEALPYEVSYEFVPILKTNDENKGNSYNDLVQLVNLQKYDAVVGDITITANRSFQSLYKLLTEDNGQSNIKDARDLVKSGVYVGYQKGSLVEMLLKQLNFDESQLKVYNSLEEYDEALSKGSKKGGVTAIFDEIPYIKLLLTKYCGKYKRIGRPIEMDGFGLVFPRGSTLVPDINRAILSIKREKMVQIESLWLGSEKTCADSISSDDTLTLERLKGLFVPFFIILFSILILSLWTFPRTIAPAGNQAPNEQQDQAPPNPNPAPGMEGPLNQAPVVQAEVPLVVAIEAPPDVAQLA
ncbi:Glutamate receptor 2.2 [Thalictrum thalictroides]|uniref:Glutamate receptor 2.2 n=1 Tax=Thalictrum thalictroides TaxID=46969 RepID=A0A7J6WL29_THATH|nr:Glutamate receptor 2.2 [Thalictrum thalictroides]